jgi:hypothetical protein
VNRRIRVATFVILLSVGVSLLGAEIPAHVQGKWQASWTGRLGSEPIMLVLKQHGTKLSGKLLRASAATPLTGSIEGNEISFQVNFPGPKPYSILFKGSVEGDSIKGTSQAQNVGASGAYLGHGGEIVQPDHPWTANRVQADRQQVAKVAR